MTPAARFSRLLLIACATALAVGMASASAETSPSASVTVVHGLAPLPGDAPVPLADRPPGAFAGDDGPSPAIFPPQRLGIRFNHKKHVKELGLGCTTCHDKVKTSHSSKDLILPSPVRCDGCHGTDHRDTTAVRTDTGDLIGQCAFCHVGYRAGQAPTRTSIPRPNLRFDHAVHLARNIACQQCHGEVENVELATRDQLPRMRGCFRCHQMPVPADGQARGACTTCHLTDKAGLLQTRFATGRLEPPTWLANAGHGPDWIERHRQVAAADSRMCASCHRADYCVACHDGRVRPRNVHPGDWIAMHPVAARQDSPRCTTCHREQSFCITCHQRAGVTMSGPYANFAGRGRFHPPRSIWTDPPRGPGHHAWEAERNLNACVSCHTERDCATCHATAGVGGRGTSPTPVGGVGQGVDPHPADFLSRCRTALRRNARPCLVCHDPADPKLGACR